jgi:hypothetical protein
LKTCINPGKGRVIQLAREGRCGGSVEGVRLQGEPSRVIRHRCRRSWGGHLRAFCRLNAMNAVLYCSGSAIYPALGFAIIGNSVFLFDGQARFSVLGRSLGPDPTSVLKTLNLPIRTMPALHRMPRLPNLPYKSRTNLYLCSHKRLAPCYCEGLYLPFALEVSLLGRFIWLHFSRT